MTEEQIKAIEQRLLGERKPIDVGDKVTIESFTGVDYVPYAHGTITKRDGEAIWLDDNPRQYWRVDACRDEPTQQDDIRALLAELKETHKRLWTRAATAEGDAAHFSKLLQEAVNIIRRYVPDALIPIASISHFLQQSEKALNSVPVEEKE